MNSMGRDYRSELLNDLVSDHDYAEHYLTAALRDSVEVFLLALRDVAESQKISKVAEASQLNRESLYRMLSKRGNPRLSSLTSVLQALGFQLTIESITPELPAAPTVDTSCVTGVASRVGRRRS